MRVGVGLGVSSSGTYDYSSNGITSNISMSSENPAQPVEYFFQYRTGIGVTLGIQARTISLSGKGTDNSSSSITHNFTRTVCSTSIGIELRGVGIFSGIVLNPEYIREQDALYYPEERGGQVVLTKGLPVLNCGQVDYSYEKNGTENRASKKTSKTGSELLESYAISLYAEWSSVSVGFKLLLPQTITKIGYPTGETASMKVDSVASLVVGYSF